MSNDLSLEKVMMGKSDSDEIVVNEFTEDAAQNFRDGLIEASKKDPKEPLIVYIDSYGGEVDALAKMIETMDEVPNPIITVTLGKAMSCGAILLSHGDMRFCGRHSRVMVHEVFCGAIGDVHDVSRTSEEIKRLNKYFMHLLAKNCNIKGGYDTLREMIKGQDGRDNYMDAQQAKDFGIVDAIGTPKVNKLLMYQVEIVGEKPKLQAVADKVKHKPKKSKKSKTKKSETNT